MSSSVLQGAGDNFSASAGTKNASVPCQHDSAPLTSAQARSWSVHPSQVRSTESKLLVQKRCPQSCTPYPVLGSERACMARSLPVQTVTACGWCLGTVCVCAASVGLHGPTRSDRQLQYRVSTRWPPVARQTVGPFIGDNRRRRACAYGRCMCSMFTHSVCCVIACSNCDGMAIPVRNFQLFREF